MIVNMWFVKLHLASALELKTQLFICMSVIFSSFCEDCNGYSMRQKNVSKIVQFNTVSFSKNAHETRVQRCRTTSQIVRIPFRFVSFRFVSFGTVLYTLRRIARSPTALLFFGEKPLRWSACRLAATLVCSRSLLATNRSLAKPFPKVGVAPLAKSPARSSSIVKAHKRNETKRNETKRNGTKRNDTSD